MTNKDINNIAADFLTEAFGDYAPMNRSGHGMCVKDIIMALRWFPMDMPVYHAEFGNTESLDPILEIDCQEDKYCVFRHR